jgi:molybdenum ABC transporter molybdate-binding protein
MANDEDSWTSDWTVGLRVWVEHGGRPVLGPGRLLLLQSIGRCHSISAAAREIGMSYAHAWQLVARINSAAGIPLVATQTGGVRGGGAQLTEQGRRAVAVYEALQERLRHAAVWSTATDDCVHVAAASSLEEVLGYLLGEYALRQPAVRVRTIFGASDELFEHLRSGGPGDLFLTAAPEQLERLAGVGPHPVLAENGLACVALADHAVAVHRPRDLLRPEVGRVALAVPSCPLGGHTRAYLQSLGLYEALGPRVLPADSARAVVLAVQGGQADVGLVYGSDAASSPGCRTLFRVRRPPTRISYAGAVLPAARQADQARRLLAFLTSDATATQFRRCGFLTRRREKQPSYEHSPRPL